MRAILPYLVEGPEVNMNRMSFIIYTAVIITFMPFRLNAATDPKSVDEYNVPNAVDECIKKIPGVSISGEINPFYLSGDLDGDRKLDFAVQVVRSGGKGLAVCLSSKKQPLLVGAGSSLLFSSGEKWRFDAWSIVPKESKPITRPAKAKYDSVLLDVKETANGLLFWDGSKLCWEQLSD